MRRFVLALLLLLPSCSRGERLDISIGTGGTGGVYYPFGGGLAEIWNRHVPGIRAVAEVTGASVENVRLAHRGETVIGEMMCDVAYQAFHGQGRFAGKPQQILALAAMYPSILQVVALEGSGIDSLGQLAGRAFSAGAPGSGTAYMCELVLPTLGIDLEALDAYRLSFVENANALRDHNIDAGAWVVAPPSSSIMDLAATHGIRVVPFTREEQERITQLYPFYFAGELPAGVYRGVDQPIPTLGVWNVIICSAGLPEDLVYQLARVLFEQNEYMRKIHPSARFTTPENTVEHSPIPLHPGAARYLKEIGLTVPARLEAR
ncbi:MAG: TAXI family TRAP transporter solute-binding subunit [Planctomycetes bacterium]|nr:TAXI family TRAP transporter solute-binding subunit [Planctomycetota bacterium]